MKIRLTGKAVPAINPGVVNALRSIDNPLRILFVCLANLCRSPMAEAMAKHLHGRDLAPDSAGVSPAPGPMLPEAVRVIKKITGFDFSGHVPRFVLDLPVQDFDYIIALDSSVFLRLNDMPQIPKDRLYGWDIVDPCGLGEDAYERTAAQIEEDLERFLLNREMEKSAPRRR